MSTERDDEPSAGREEATEIRPVDVRLGFFPFRDAFRRPRLRLRAVLLVYLPVYLAGLLVVVPLQQTGDSVLVDGTPELLGPAPQWLAASAVLLLFGVLAMLVAHGAATLIGVAESVRVTTGPAEPTGSGAVAPSSPPAIALRSAVAAAVRRLPTLFVLWLLGALFVTALLVGVFASTFGDIPIGVPIAAACLVGWLAFAPFAVAWPVALAERRGPFGALRRSVQLTHGRRFRPGLAVLVFGYGIPGGLGYVIARVPDLTGRWLAPWPAAAVVAVLGWTVAVATPAVLASVQVAVLFSDKVVAGPHTTTDDEHTSLPLRRERYAIDRDRLLGVLGEPAPEWRWVATRRPDVAARTLAGLLVPGLLVTGLLWLNPARVPAYTKAVLSDSSSNLRNRLLPMPDGSVTVVTQVRADVYLGRCARTRCVSSVHGEDPELFLLGVGATTGPGDGRIVLSGWHLTDDSDHAGESVLRLLVCRPKQCTDDAVREAPVLDRYEPRYDGDSLDDLDVRTAVTGDGNGGYVVASFDRQAGRLRTYHCADERCTDPATAVLGRPGLTILPYDSALLGLAVDRGRVAAVVTDTNTGAVTHYSCADLDCADPRSTVVVGPSRIRSELDTQYRVGAQVAFNGSDLPVIAYRDLLDGTVRLVSCADLACERRSSYQLTGQGWGHPWPALAVDRTGRPLVATYDLEARQLVLVACRSSSCDQRETVRLARWQQRPGNTAVTVDRAGRPVVLRNDISPVGGLFDRGRAEVLACEAARCGAR